MSRFALRQFRPQAIVALAGLTLVAVVVALTGPHLVHLYDTEIAHCGAHANCSSATNALLATDAMLRTWLGVLVIVLPGIIGIFWGAPLVAREIEAGTHRLAWTQSISRTRWLVTKVAVVGATGMVVTGLLSLLVTWWASPLDHANAQAFSTFDERAIVPIGYAALAFALGVTIGVVIRRVLPAMATTLIAFVSARLAFTHLVRPHLATPLTRDSALSLATTGYGSYNGGPANLIANPPMIPNAWVYSADIVNNAGRSLSPQDVARACPTLSVSPPGGGQTVSGHAVRAAVPEEAQHALQECITRVGASFHIVTTYQPQSHYWVMQWGELSAYLVAALMLVGVCTWWVRTRL